MKKLPLALALAYGAVCTTGTAQKSPSHPEIVVPDDPAAANTAVANAQRVSGTGLCRVHFDHDGRAASVTMTRSTGSAALDEDAVRSAQRNWRGLPDSAVTVPVKYNAAPIKKDGGPIRYTTPIPEYPTWATRQLLSGTCLLQVLFDQGGKATFAVVVKSSGNKALDNYTVRHALSFWRSSGGEESVLTYPVTYLYQGRKVPGSDRLVDPGFRSYY